MTVTVWRVDSGSKHAGREQIGPFCSVTNRFELPVLLGLLAWYRLEALTAFLVLP